MNFSVKKNLIPELNITPLIDVILMLLIFFMISTSFVFQPGIMVKLPESGSSEVTTAQGAQVLITVDNQIYFERLRTSMDELEEHMRNHPDKTLLQIKADQTVTHGFVVEVMDRAKRAGFQRLAIATTPLKSSSEGRL